MVEIAEEIVVLVPVNATFTALDGLAANQPHHLSQAEAMFKGNVFRRGL